jgi:hypothetical protein
MQIPPALASLPWRSPVVLAAIIIAAALLLGSCFTRYEAGTNGVVVDRLTGEACLVGRGCFKHGRQVRP